MISNFFRSIGALWLAFLDSLDSPGGHVLIFLGLYLGLTICQCAEQDRQAMFQALLLVLRPQPSKKT